MDASTEVSSTVRPEAHYATTPAQTLDGRLSMLASRMTYVALSFYFAAFYFAIIYLQLINENGLWMAKGVHRPTLWFGIVEMGLILGAGIVYFWGQWYGVRENKYGQLKISLWIAAILGVIAVGFHIYELHAPNYGGGGPGPGFLQSGGYASVFTGVEGMYTLLLAVTVLGLIGMAIRASRGIFQRQEAGAARINAFGEFWGWMSALALLNFLALYVQPFFPIR
ncbi:MAG: hypothetical protein ACRDFS_04010 [Chloroflexota bacterium]